MFKPSPDKLEIGVMISAYVFGVVMCVLSALGLLGAFE